MNTAKSKTFIGLAIFILILMITTSSFIPGIVVIGIPLPFLSWMLGLAMFGGCLWIGIPADDS